MRFACLQKLIHLEHSPWLWTFVPHRMHPVQHQRLPSLSSNNVGKCQLKLLDLGLGKTANINSIRSANIDFRHI